jgi:hypothetical protein
MMKSLDGLRNLDEKIQKSMIETNRDPQAYKKVNSFCAIKNTFLPNEIETKHLGFTIFQFGNLDLTKPPPLDKTGLLLNLFLQ